MKAPDQSNYLKWKMWDPDAFGRCPTELRHYYEKEIPLVLIRAKPVLEIGFGNGTFLGWLQANGTIPYGIELDPELRKRGEKLLGPGRVFESLDSTGLQRLNGGFSGIVAFDVIEHVPEEELPAFFSRMHALLADDGVIVLRFPNGDSPFGRIWQHGDIAHKTTIGKYKLKYFALCTGLDVRQLRQPAVPILGSGCRQAIRRTMIRLARKAIEKPLRALYFPGENIPLDPLYVAVLRKTVTR